MKLAPTDLDREAARLFAAAPRMRAWFAESGADARACTVIDVSTLPGDIDPRKPRRWVAWESPGGACDWVRVEYLTALDTDDGPTQGAMMAQVGAALDAAGCPGAYLHPWADGWAVRRGAAIRRYAGPTKGAALVAAKRALAAPETA